MRAANRLARGGGGRYPSRVWRQRLAESSPIDALVRLGPFKDTSPDAVRDLATRASWVRYGVNDVVYAQGEAMKPEAILLVTGRFSVVAESGGVRRSLADVWPGEFVGEPALFTRGATRSATVVASAPSVGLRVSRQLLADQAGHPAVVALEQHLIRVMVRRIQSTSQTLHRVLTEQAAGRGFPGAAKGAAAPPNGHPAAPADAVAPPGDRPARPAGPPSPGASRPPSRGSTPPPEPELTLAQRLARWFTLGSG